MNEKILIKENPMSENPGIISPQDLKKRISDPNDTFILVDVRQPDEHEEARIDGDMLIPLASLATQFETLPRDQDLVIYCRSGRRSQQACLALCDAGFARVFNVTGGILAWQALA